jgi:hypothetical protein
MRKKMMRLREIMEKPIIVTAEGRYEEWGEQGKSLDINLTFLLCTPLLQRSSLDRV